MVEQWNSVTAVWWEWMLSIFWQVGTLIVLVGVVDLVIRRWVWPQLRYAMWLLVLVKLVLPPGLTSPASLTSKLQPFAKETLALSSQTPEQPDVADSASYPLPRPALEYQPINEPLPSIAQEPPAQPAVSENLPLPQVKLHWKFYPMLVWFLGVWILTGWFVLYWRRLARQFRNSSTAESLPDWFFDSVRETADLIGLRRVPKVAVSSTIATPAVFGVFRPMLLMPTANLDTLSRRDGRHILLHELAHIKRRDPLVHTVNLLLQIVYWFNPLLWLVRKQLQHLRELCCDATVAKVLKENTIAYRETLLETAKRLLAKPVEPGLGLLGLFENSHRIVTRLQWLEKKTWKHGRLRFAVVLIALAFMGACILPMAADDTSQPTLLLTGIVTDADTGTPIAGAKVSDDGYGPKPYRHAVTDANGKYQYHTWSEEHNIVIEADGYESQHKVLTSSMLQNEKEITIDFQLEPAKDGIEKHEAIDADNSPASKVVLAEEKKLIPSGLVGTWFFKNDVGDDEQMAIFPDGRVVVLYSNGHIDDTRPILHHQPTRSLLNHSPRGKKLHCHPDTHDPQGRDCTCQERFRRHELNNDSAYWVALAVERFKIEYCLYHRTGESPRGL